MWGRGPCGTAHWIEDLLIWRLCRYTATDCCRLLDARRWPEICSYIATFTICRYTATDCCSPLAASYWPEVFRYAATHWAGYLVIRGLCGLCRYIATGWQVARPAFFEIFEVVAFDYLVWAGSVVVAVDAEGFQQAG